MNDQVSTALDEAIRGLAENAERTGLAETTRRQLLYFARDIVDIRDKVWELEQVVALPLAHTAEPVDPSTLSIEELVETSALLDGINSTGVTIRRVEWFSPQHIRAARDLATDFHDISVHLRAFRSSQNRDGEHSFLTPSGKCLKAFLMAGERAGAFEVTKVLSRKSPQDKWRFFKWKDWDGIDDHQYLVVYKIIDSAMNHFLYGDWMTAFVGHVIADHLGRNRIDHEVFNKVEYEAPVDIIRSRGDFDVIAMFKGKAFCFECKSGNIDKEAAESIERKSAEIRAVLETFAPDLSDFHFFVVYDERINADQAVQDLFSAGIVEPRRIDQIRGLVAEAAAA